MEKTQTNMANDSPTAAEKTPSIFAYELAIGVTAEDESTLLKYWEQFGFSVEKSGKLSAAEVNQLYAVNSGLRSHRLHNQVKDRGLLRLMVWEKPVNEGLGLSPLKVLGSRWGAMLSLDVFNVANHAEDAIAAGLPVYCVPPQRNLIYRPDSFQPFIQANPCIHEMVLIQALTRQVIFTRHDYSMPLSGVVNPESHFKASEFVHLGMVVTGGKEQLNFYEQVLGLECGVDSKESQYGEASRLILELKGPENGENLFTTDFISPGTSTTDLSQVRSGRLHIMRIEGSELPNKHSHSRPGCLGVSLYTIKVEGIESYYQKVSASAAREITKLCENEFGEKSFSFIAPDGYFWTLLD